MSVFRLGAVFMMGVSAPLVGCNELLSEPHATADIGPDSGSNTLSEPKLASANDDVRWGEEVSYHKGTMRLGIAVDDESATLVVQNAGDNSARLYVAGGFSLTLNGNGQTHEYYFPSESNSLSDEDNYENLDSGERYELTADLGDFARGDDGSRNLAPGEYQVQARYGFMPRLVSQTWVGFLESASSNISLR